ncbi:PP2C family protein-serine/threonine phosphatase [Streptomyces varsoviensis]|uniref:PP2C family protein-serine/threonine phosphatase n=1 Tax=Streptomyces varsoviensis TaxID=67373 RepID=UPI0006905284|nr:PP2C family protein-serine/threonine phosphatase [Streptomyces varsoviensis]
MTSLTTAARNVAADRATRSGGDLHAARVTRYGLRLLIGDVRGKGPRAAAGAAALLAAFDAAAGEAPTLHALETAPMCDDVKGIDIPEQSGIADYAGHTDHTGHVHHADGADHADGAHIAGRAAVSNIADIAGVTEIAGVTAMDRTGPDRSGDSVEHFATAVLAQIPEDGETVQLLNLGHPAPLLLGPRTVRRLEPRRRGLPLGLRALSPGPVATETLPLPVGATLLLLTDGVTEARNADGAFYDPAARLARFGGAAPEELLDRLLRDVRWHVGGPPTDDMALLAVRRSPSLHRPVRPCDRPPRQALATP